MIKSIADYMLKHDKVAVWLGIEIVEVSKGYALIKMKVKDNPVLVEFLRKFNLPIEPKQAWTDVAQLSYHGIDAVNFGPGQPHQAHQRNEYVEIEKVEECYRILHEFLKE